MSDTIGVVKMGMALMEQRKAQLAFMVEENDATAREVLDAALEVLQEVQDNLGSLVILLLEEKAQ